MNKEFQQRSLHLLLKRTLSHVLSPVNQYSLSNDGNATVYVGISATTPFNVALPGTASGYVIPVLANSTRIITTIQTGFNNVYAKIIGNGTNASCYITPGEGI